MIEKTMKTLRNALCLAMAAGLLAGCSDLMQALEKSANYTDVEKIDYNLYRISGERGNINQELQLRDYLYQRAKDFCMRHSQGAQLLEAVSGRTGPEHVKAQLIFRCVGILKTPEKEFIDNSPEADTARREAERKAREEAEEKAEAEAEAKAKAEEEAKSAEEAQKEE